MSNLRKYGNSEEENEGQNIECIPEWG